MKADSQSNSEILNHGQLATFWVDDLFFGIDVMKVQEIIRYQEMTPVPLASPTVRGLVNLRGQIITAIDMRRRLKLPDFPEGKLPMNVIIRSAEGVVSLLVDKIGDVIEYDNSKFETTPCTLPAAQKELINGVCKLPRQLLLILNHERAVEVSHNDFETNPGLH
jgi:purine-binding chemotaxis protein CheW